MRTFATLLLLSASLPAAAQDDAQILEDVVAKRFADDDHPGPTLSAGDEVTVILRDATRARVAKGNKYGWVPASVLGEVQAEAASPEPLVPGFDIEAIKRSLEMTE